MGRRGPQPKPTALRLVEGNPGHRSLPRGEPQPELGPPEMPDFLPPLAEKAWKSAVAEMTAVPGWLARIDWRILETWAIDYAIWRDAVAAIKESGMTFLAVFIDGAGQEHHTPKARPEMKIINDTVGRLLRAEGALGFAPSFRTRLDLSGAVDAQDNVLEA